jgi:FkbM family methyltransferase
VLDIGANVGKVTLILAKQVGDTGKVYSFEPEQNNFDLLKKNIEINNLKNVIPLRYAVTDKNEKTLLKVSGACTTHQICTDTDEATQEIETISLDEYFKDQRIDFMKIDAEGSEPKIINGMKGIVKNNPNLKFITEYEVRVMTALKVDRVKYTDDLISLGYEIFETRDGVKELIPTSSAKLANYYNTNSPYRTNLFCIKSVD